MKVPKMLDAMRNVGIRILDATEATGLSGVILTEMTLEGELAEPYYFTSDECMSFQGFMASARTRIRDRINGGATVVLVGISVLLRDIDRMPAAGLEAPGAAVFAVNRSECAAEIYIREGDLAHKVLKKKKNFLLQKLNEMNNSFFRDISWPTVH